MVSVGSSGHAIAIKLIDSRIIFAAEGRIVPSARCVPSLKMLQKLFSDFSVAAENTRAALLLQTYDYAERTIRSVAYSRRPCQAEAVGLIMDTYFFNSQGYQELREAVPKFTPWRERSPIVFWRGSSTFDHVLENGKHLSIFEEIPRVLLCKALARVPATDVRLSGTWGEGFFGKKRMDEFHTYIKAMDLIDGRVSMIDHARYKYQIDIDGVGNAWGFFEKLLLGSCILKVESKYEQWFYRDLRPWEHYIPVDSDLRNLVERIEWCNDHDEEAQMIGAAAQQMALSYSFEHARKMTIFEMLAHLIIE